MSESRDFLITRFATKWDFGRAGYGSGVNIRHRATGLWVSSIAANNPFYNHQSAILSMVALLLAGKGQIRWIKGKVDSTESASAKTKSQSSD